MKWQWMMAVLALAATAAGAESGSLARDSEVRKEPFNDAEVVASLPAQTAVDLVKRKGAWVEIQHGETRGWVRMLGVRVAPAEGKAPAGSGASGIDKLFNTARTGSSGTAVATGVRGLDSESLKNATPNEQALDSLAGQKADEGSARKLASEPPPLKSQEVPHLPTPAVFSQEGNQ